MPLFYLIITFLFIPDTIQASEYKYRNKALSIKLWEHPEWAKLLKYKKNNKSAVVTDSFFYSSNGKNSPKDELLENISQAFSTKKKDLNKSFQCLYPARNQFFSENLESWPISSKDCSDFYKWSNLNNVDSVSLIFATGYFSNPGSFFGHILIKLNEKNNQKTNQLLDKSINFGAIGTEKDNPVVYIIKGLFGGYNGGFTHGLYYRHHHMYGENDLRDIWNYKLNLSKRDKEFLIKHSWEMIGKKYKYYFMKQNCGFRMAEMVELVTPHKLFYKSSPYFKPIHVFNSIFNYEKKHNTRLISSFTKVPSRQTKFRVDYFTLDKTNQKLLKDSFKNGFKNQSYLKLSQDKKVNLLDIALNYSEFSNKKTKTINPNHKTILINRGNLKSTPPIDNFLQPTKSLKNAKKPGSLLTSYLYNNTHNSSSLYLKLRPAYFNLITEGIAFKAPGELTTNEIQLLIRDKGADLTDYTLVGVNSLNNNVTGFKHDGGFSWAFKTGFYSWNNLCSTCLKPTFQIEAGQSFGLPLLPYQYLRSFVAIHDTKKNSGPSSFGLKYGVITPQWGPLAIHSEVTYRVSTNSKFDADLILKTIGKISLSRNNDIEFGYSYNNGAVFNIGINRFF